MIFPLVSVHEFRRELAQKMNSGALSDAEAFRQALAVDPHDPAASRFLALTAEEASNASLAAQLAHRFIEANPVSHEGYLLLGRVLSDAPLAAAYAALGRKKLHFDPEAQAELGPSDLAEPPAAPDSEPEAVSRELEPHRLLHELFVAGLEAIDASLIDRVLARGADCAPLLLGVLNAYGEDLLSETDDGLVVRALALLGEIGEPAVLPALARFVPLEDDTIGGAARWAFLRIARRLPAEALDVIRRLAIGAEALDLAALAQQLCLMPDTPGRSEVLLSLADNLAEFDKDERDLVIVSMLTSAYVMHGAASEAAAIIETQYGALLSREARKELKSLRAEIEAARQEITESEEPSIYEVCLDGFDVVDAEPFERAEPKLGRNEPCWCGSGKKYKKCHLDADEGR
ncbi:MAG: SEC-C domain-containing protein [Candidatus Solibacter sp.]|nr:SEC-C domain-containing protein [Candidatus Solibacter sp.]